MMIFFGLHCAIWIVIDLDDMTKYTFQWCLLDDGLGLKVTRTEG